MSNVSNAGGAAPLDDEMELDRLIDDEAADTQGASILKQMRQELSAGEDQMRRMGEDLAAARHEQGRLDAERGRLQAELGDLRGQVDGLRRERDMLEEKIRDMIKVSEAEMTKIIDHTERIQHLRFAQEEASGLAQQVQALETELAAERAVAAKHLEDLRGTQAHRDILEQKIAGMLGVMHAEVQKIVDHTERQFAAAAAGLEARERLAAAIARGDALEQRGREIEHRERETIAAIHRSMSWWLTKPVRFASRLLARAGIRRPAR